MPSIKEDLIGEQFVTGNIRDSVQMYKIFYYPPELPNYPSSKVWLYFNRKDGEKILGTKSLCFNNVENHRNFIINNILYHLYWLERVGSEYKPSTMDIHTFRRKLMEALLLDIRQRTEKVVKEKLEKVIV